MHLTSNNLGTFREQICRHLLNLDFKSGSQEAFTGFVETFGGAPQGMCMRLRHSPGALFRDRELVKDGVDSLSLIFLDSGGYVEQNGREAEIRRGGATLLRNNEPGASGSRRFLSCVAVILPPDALRSVDGGALDRLNARPWAPTPALKLLRDYAVCLSKIEASPEVTTAAGRHLCELARLAASESEAQPESEELWQVRHSLALQTIARRYRDPWLDENAVAAEQGVSTRYLQKIFERDGVKFVDRLNEARLAAAHRDLTDEKLKGVTILRLAMDAGYRDVSHFNRLFLRRFGKTPSEARKSSLADR